MELRGFHEKCARVFTLAASGLLLFGVARGAAKDVDLNGDGTPESTVSLTVVTSSPVKVQDKITNKALGQSFRFAWLSAGPGGFSSSLNPGSTGGVGAIWTWQTTRQVFSYTGSSCTNDICLNRTLPADNRQAGPFSVPGRSLSTSSVTTTSESLTSSLITFFSTLLFDPQPQELFSLTSSVDQIAPGVYRYKTVLENSTGQPITVNQSAGPFGCDTNCGNGVIEGDETCDGSNLGEAGCGMFGQIGNLLCGADCHSYDASDCHDPQCGNNVREATEQCDGSDLLGLDCENFGGSGGPLGCAEDCRWDFSNCAGVCGNGLREGSEPCDGNDFGGETCESQGGTGSGVGFTYSKGFESGTVCSGSCPIQPNGSATRTVDEFARPVLRLTPALGGQAGSAWYRTPQPVAGGFTTTFTFRLSHGSPSHADGLAFVVQNASVTSVGGGGQLMGYNFPNSVAVEFDTYHNPDSGDHNANHVAVQSCGTSSNSPNHDGVEPNCGIGSVNDSPGITLWDGNIHTATITYEPDSGSVRSPGELSLYLDGSPTPALLVPFDMASIGLGGSGADHAWVGFTAATGADYQDHDILGWSFTPTEPDSSGSLACNDFCQIDVSQCSNICGNGITEAGEECDRFDVGDHTCADQGGVGEVTCSSDCHLNYTCDTAYCGNGVRDEGEECDGSDLGDYSCDSLGGGGGPLACDANCNFDVTHCTNLCGNGVREGEEDCDGTEFGGLTCADFGGNAVDGHLTCVGCGIESLSCEPDPPDCEVPASSNIVPPAEGDPGKVETCEISAHPAKEISTKVVVCGTSIPEGNDTCGTEPATSGTANIFVPDLDTTIGSVFFTATGIQISDPDGNGLPKPGETVNVTIPLINAGLGTATNVHAVLSSPPYDLDGDGVDDPVTISQPASEYPGAPCFVGLPTGATDCNFVATPPVACANITPFVVTFPAGHPADVGRKFILSITYSEPTLGQTTALFVRPITLGVGGAAVCGNGILETGEQCDETASGCCSLECQYEPADTNCAQDGNLCTSDHCDAGGVCLHTEVDAACDDHDPCTSDSCTATGCVYGNLTGPACDDHNVCTTVDVCNNGQCQGSTPPDCNDGNTCTDDACVPGGCLAGDLTCVSGPVAGCVHTSNNTCGANPKGQGYWKRICSGPHPSGEFISQVDADCVNDTCTFDDVHTAADVCDRMNPNPQNDKCEKAEAHFMTLLLNVCRGRVNRFEATQSGCNHNTTVDQAIQNADALLCSPSRTNTTCTNAQCETEEINNGKALGVTSLRVNAAHNGPVVLTWGPPYVDSDQNITALRYRVWRRPNSNSVFTQLVQTSNLTYTDTTANGVSYQYEVTVVW